MEDEVIVITAPTVLLALDKMGVKSVDALKAIDQDELNRMMREHDIGYYARWNIRNMRRHPKWVKYQLQPMTESAFQSKLIKKYEREGWYVLKLIQTNKPGIPDLLLLKPDAVKMVEVKGPKGRLSKVQEYRHQELRAFGFDVETLKP